MITTIEQLLEQLAVMRGSWRSIEDQNRNLLEGIKAKEREIKEQALVTGEEATAGGLKLSFVSGRVTYDGHALHDVSEHLEAGLAALEAKVWDYADTAPDMVRELSNHLSGMRTLLARALRETKKQGEKTLRISEVKEKKADE
jgi:hypothetical protein